MKLAFLHLSSVFFGGSRPIHYLHAYAKAYANLRGLRGVPTRAQVSFQVPTRMPTRANVEFECRSAVAAPAGKSQLFSFGSSGSKIRIAVQVISPHLSKDLAARKGLRTQNALKAYANAYAGPTRSLRKDSRTNRRKAKEANSFILGKQH